MKQGKFSIIKRFPIFALIALIAIAPGLVGLVTLPFGVNLFNMDVDFIGGTSMTFDIHEEVTSDISSKTIPELVQEAVGIEPSSVQKTGDDGEEVLIKCTRLDSDQQKQVVQAMQKQFNLSDDDTQNISDVNATIGKETQGKAIVAALVAVILMMIYITIRFELTSGLAAITCLANDLLVVLSTYVIFRIPFNTTFIAVALTILGYSINASIIVFDRIRENRKFARRELFEDTVEKSIWQTVGRTVNTSVTTLLTVGMIFIFGVTSLRQFTLPMIIGIIAGAYSSMFLSGAFWSKYRGMARKNRKEKAQKKVSKTSEKKAVKPQPEKTEEAPEAEEEKAEPIAAPQPAPVKKVTPKKTSRKQRKKKH